MIVAVTGRGMSEEAGWIFQVLSYLSPKQTGESINIDVKFREHLLHADIYIKGYIHFTSHYFLRVATIGTCLESPTLVSAPSTLQCT